ncbi:MAG: hypothetical protein P4L68_10785 [Methylovirgula sp.]|nr:hypothetical protein [Methylovirgula sp.]
MSRESRIKELRWKAFSHAATACAIHVAKIVPVGDIDLSADYRTKKLEEIGRALELDLTTEQIPGAACLVLNWSILAQVQIGAPRFLFNDADIAELLVENDPVGLNLMRRHWPAIERVAVALLCKGRLAEAEAIAIMGSAV